MSAFESQFVFLMPKFWKLPYLHIIQEHKPKEYQPHHMCHMINQVFLDLWLSWLVWSWHHIFFFFSTLDFWKCLSYLVLACSFCAVISLAEDLKQNPWIYLSDFCAKPVTSWQHKKSNVELLIQCWNWPVSILTNKSLILHITVWLESWQGNKMCDPRLGQC